MNETDEEYKYQVRVPKRRDGEGANAHIMSLVMTLMREAQEPEGKAFDDLLCAISGEVHIACNGWVKPGDQEYHWGQQNPVVDNAAQAYREAFDSCAGPSQFRHAVNYDKYHRAGIAGVVNYVKYKMREE